MIAVDTNLVVRLLTADHPEQALKAKRLFQTEQVFVCRTVLLEVAWVLRSTYELNPTAVLDAITKLLGLPGVVVDDAECLARALDLARSGMDFADALHVMASPDSVSFVTFDKALDNAAEQCGRGIRVRLLD